jgi:hypothetical protein
MVPKILLLVNSDPSGSGIGELFLREIGNVYPIDSLVRYSTVQQRQIAGESNWLGFKSTTRYVRSSRLPIFSSFSEWSFSTTVINLMAEEIASIVKAEKIDLIWSVLSSGAIINLTERLLGHLQVPIVSTILDDPQYFAKNRYLDPFTFRYLQTKFAHVLRRSRRISVIGESMQSIYRACYGVESIIMRHGIDQSHFQPWRGNSSADKTIRIGFAGSLYAKKEWNSLLKMLDSSGGRIAGKDVRISFIGRFPRTGARRSRFVDYLGPMPFASALNAVRETDIAYLPYWFDRRHAITVRTSFPGKLSTYAACGIPVLYHGPEDSSVTQFIRDFPFGISCHSLKEDEINFAITTILEDENFHLRAGAARDQALEKELSLGVMLQRFCELVDCRVSDLKEL